MHMNVIKDNSHPYQACTLDKGDTKYSVLYDEANQSIQVDSSLKDHSCGGTIVGREWNKGSFSTEHLNNLTGVFEI